MLNLARSNPRTSIAGLVGFLSLAVGALGTYQGGQWWPILLGVVCKGLADALGHVLAADAKETP